MTLQTTHCQEAPNAIATGEADADYIVENLQQGIRTGNLETAARVLTELQDWNKRDTGYPQGNPFLDRAYEVLLRHQIQRANQAIAYRENPEIATGELLMLNDNARQFMENAPVFHKAAAQTYTSVRMNHQNMLPMTREQGEAKFRDTAGEAPPETGEQPLHPEYAAWVIHRQAKETFLKIGLEFRDEDALDLSRFANMNLATAAAAACAAGILNPDGTKAKLNPDGPETKQDRLIVDDSP